MASDQIEELIRTYVDFYKERENGWNSTYCEVCGDGSHTKGRRGGWLFSEECVFYHCFNCGVDGNFDPNREFPFSKNMRNIFDSFGIPKKEYNLIAYISKDVKTTPIYSPVKIPRIDIPDHFYLLSKAKRHNLIAEKAIYYLLRRNINLRKYKFYLSTGNSKINVGENAKAKSLFGRIIIPFFNKGNLIYYQARALENNSKLRYLDADGSKTSILFNMDELYKITESPLFVTEGVFDAMLVNGCATLENRLSNNQIELLQKSKRRKVIIPDFKSDSQTLVRQALDLGWEVSFPELGDMKDISAASEKYGILYTLVSVMNNIKEGHLAKFNLKKLMKY